jgi:hypothetical protein
MSDRNTPRPASGIPASGIPAKGKLIAFGEPGALTPQEAASKSAQVRGEARLRRREKREALAFESEERVKEELMHLVGPIITTQAKIVEVTDSLIEAVEAAIESGNFDGIAKCTALMKVLVNEEQRLMDRLYGAPTQRAKTENHNVNANAVVNLSDLLASRRQRE